MNLSRESMLALERHFVGVLSAPARAWLEPLPASQLAFAGSAIRSHDGKCVVDFGTVDSPGRECHLVRVINRGRQPAQVHLAEHPKWLSAHWLGGSRDPVPVGADDAGETLELVAAHDVESRFDGCIRFLIRDGGMPRIEDVLVRMTTRRAYPIAHFDFNGSPVPRPFDLGNGSHPYQLTVTNSSSVPLVVRFVDLPPWLTFDVGGQRRSGPLAGPFFERRAPFTIRLWARGPGKQSGALHIGTNDPRPQFRSLSLQLFACVDTPRPEANPTVRRESRGPSAVSTVRKPSPDQAETLPVIPLPPRRRPIKVQVVSAVAILLLIVLFLLVRGLT